MMKRKEIMSQKAVPPEHTLIIEPCYLFKYRWQNNTYDMIFQKFKTKTL